MLIKKRVSTFMSTKKEKRGRPKVDSELLRFRGERDLINAIDAFVSEQPDSPSRPEAIRRLLKDNLIRLGHMAPEELR